MDLNSTKELNNGYSFPVFGLVTWDMYKETLISAISYALSIGYRSFDTASYYHNDKEVGIAIRESVIPREDTFVTTKVYPSEFKNIRREFEGSFNSLNL